jgi:hypothetical protein
MKNLSIGSAFFLAMAMILAAFTPLEKALGATAGRLSPGSPATCGWENLIVVGTHFDR